MCEKKKKRISHKSYVQQYRYAMMTSDAPLLLMSQVTHMSNAVTRIMAQDTASLQYEYGSTGIMHGAWHSKRYNRVGFIVYCMQTNV